MKFTGCKSVLLMCTAFLCVASTLLYANPQRPPWNGLSIFIMRFKASVANISWPGPKQNILERLRGEAKLNRGALVELKPIESIRLDLSAIFFLLSHTVFIPFR